MSESEQAIQIDRWTLKASQCQTCGRPVAECSDPTIAWYANRTICYPSMALAAFNARWRDQHSTLPYHDGSFSTWTAERTAGTPYHFNDGVRIWVAQSEVNPDDDFLGSPEREVE